MSEKKLNSAKKYKITRQYKYLSHEFNPECIKARYNLNYINLYMKEREKNKKNKKSLIKEDEEKNVSIVEDENKKSNKNQLSEEPKKIKPFVCPSDKEIKKLIYYQRLEKHKISKENGFKNYIKKMIPNSMEVQNFQNKINNNASLNYDFYVMPKIENKNRIQTKKRTIVSAFQINKSIFKKNKKKNKTIISAENKYIRNKNNKYNTSRFLTKEEKYIFNIKNNNRVMSAPKLDWREKKLKWKEKNKNVAEEDYKFYLDRPISPLTNDKSVKPLPRGGGVLYSNSIWRIKKINDLVPKLNYDAVEKLNDFKKKRNEIIYNKENSIPYDLTFLSNRIVKDNNDFFSY